MVNVRTENITKRFGKVVAVDHVSIEVKHGELFTLLGPSGCGKTTTLRIIAGLEKPDEGRVYFDDIDVTHVPPYKRNVGMVFQNWALWPHMTVYDNVAYGLKIRKLPKDEIDRRVKEVLRLVGLEGLEKRYPHQLSGGQQQRVALARALVVEPRVLLLDEPLSNLDARLRIRMREEIKRIQKKLGITTIYVTHDQEEAMSISDRIAIMHRGKILQIGTPEYVYKNPANLFVASFIGRSSSIRGIVRHVDGVYATISIGSQNLKGKIASRYPVREGDEIVVVVKPEDVDIDGKENCVEGTIVSKHFLGFVRQIIVNVENNRISVFTEPDRDFTEGETIRICIDESKAFVFHKKELVEIGLEELV